MIFKLWQPVYVPIYAVLIIISDTGRRIVQATSEQRAAELLRQHPSVEIQRSNTASVLATVPLTSRLQEIFMLL